MYKEIFDILVRETRSDKLLDENALREIFYLFVNNNKINNYVSDFEIEDLGKDNFGHYSMFEGIIRINTQAIINYYESYPLYIINLYILKTFFHELYHACQVKQFDNKNLFASKYPLVQLEYLLNYIAIRYTCMCSYCYTDLEKDEIEYLKLLNIEYKKDFYLNLKAYYDYYHDYIIQERFSDLDSLRLLNSIISTCDDNNVRKEETLKVITLELTDLYLTGYELDEKNNDYITPLENYVEIFKLDNYTSTLDGILDRVFRKSDLSNTTKYRYGLKLNNAVIDKTKALHDELDNCIKEKKKTNKWNYIS